MKNVIILILGIIFSTCYSQKKTDSIKYFDENNKEISRTKFERIRSTNKLLEIPGDFKNHYKLISRKKNGKLENRALLETLLEKETNQEIDATKPMIIIFYPGKDPCNSSGSDNKEARKIWFRQLEGGINFIAQTRPIYIYKDEDGLEKYNHILLWYKDPDQIVEKTFFKHHYPCSSFVVISKNGDYYSYFGEFTKEQVWEATKLMSK